MKTNEIKKQDNNITKNEMRMPFNDGSRTLSWLEKFLVLINTFGVKKILQACFFFVAFFLTNILFNVLQNDTIVEQIVTTLTKTHLENADIRTEINPKVSNKLLKMVYELHADRAYVWEMHNGKENPTSLPFLYCDMTYEEVDETKNVPYISHEYENLNMSKYKLFSYLYTNRFFIGNIEELKNIDKKMAMRMEVNNTHYTAIILIKSGIEIGFLGLSYDTIPKLSRDEIHAKLGDYVQDMSNLLDLSKQKKLLK